MLDDRQIYDKLKQMPEPLKAEVVHYMDFLLSKYAGQPVEPDTAPKRRPHPALAGMLTIKGDLLAPIAEDDWEAKA